MGASTGLKEQLQGYIDGMPFARGLGIALRQADRGRVTLSLEPKPQCMNHFGTYQAGALYTLSEVTGGVLCGSFFDLAENFLVTKTSEIRFQGNTDGGIVSEASLAESAIAEALQTVREKGKTELAVEVVIRSAAGDILSTGKHLYYLRAGIPKLESGAKIKDS